MMNAQTKTIDSTVIPSKFIEIDGLNCHYFDEGEGPVILCLHPAPGTCHFYRRLIGLLHHRFRVIAPDFPGFGKSAGSNEFSLQKLRDFVLRFMDHLGLKQVSLLVTDASGAVGLGAATDAPKRFSSLIIMDTFAFPLTGKLLPVRIILRYIMPFVKYLNRMLNLFPWLVATLGCFRNPLRGEERKNYLQAFATSKQRDGVIDWFHELGRNTEYLQKLEESIRTELNGHRSLILFGQFDPMRVLGAHNRFRQLLKNSRIYLIPWEEHFPVLGSTGRVADTIEQWFEDLR